MKKMRAYTRGFTLLEILLVVAIISILAGIVIVAINPAKQLGDARNAQRRADVATILSAVYQFVIDNNGVLPNHASFPDLSSVATYGTTFPSTQSASTSCSILAGATVGAHTLSSTIYTYNICKSTATTCTGTPSNSAANVLISELVSGTVAYVSSLPQDPGATTTEDGTAYLIAKIPGNRILICAPLTENSVDMISAMR